ncbi:MAG: phosphate acetyltransferase [Clostridiaceae bacterium]|jgi:phosphate acetyltransferase|nr:phosphate acetyltransferase [Clostridiaceae bacterium]
MTFMENVLQKAKAAKKTVVLPESEDPRVAAAAAKILSEQIADIILIGEKDKICKLHPDLDLSQARFEDPATSILREEFNQKYWELRKHKGCSESDASEEMAKAIPFGVMMLKAGLADGLVAGAVHSTADTLRPALQILRTKPGTKLVSSFILIDSPQKEFGEDGLLLFSDVALMIDPDADQLSEIALSSAESFKRLTGKEARVAMLSFSTFGSGTGKCIEKVVEATALAKGKNPDIILEGELQADAALVPIVAALKAPGSKIAGKANCLIFPDLNSANISYKLVQRLGKAGAYGPILQGIAKPVNDLSRGASVDDIIGVVALTCVQSTQETEN